jgi:hypothetical protein
MERLNPVFPLFQLSDIKIVGICDKEIVFYKHEMFLIGISPTWLYLAAVTSLFQELRHEDVGEWMYSSMFS